MPAARLRPRSAGREAVQAWVVGSHSAIQTAIRGNTKKFRKSAGATDAITGGPRPWNATRLSGERYCYRLAWPLPPAWAMARTGRPAVRAVRWAPRAQPAEEPPASAARPAVREVSPAAAAAAAR